MIVWPLQMILFQFLFLLVAIALEARVLQRRLRITRKASIEYATSINLLTIIIGWLVFFLLMTQKNLLPPAIKDQIVSFIFFDRFLSPAPGNWYLILIATGIVIFFCAFIIKLKGLQLLEALRETSTAKKSFLQPEPSSRFAFQAQLEQALVRTDPNQATTLLLANAYSHSAIFLLLFLRFISPRVY
ncbi:MAG TPA: filament integrity protein fraC [Cyanobacteria bacterium UBA8553]|nr:filament integrity protein fraC [Cyanobacteria bacterium UBA8553]HAJ60677.1 filament integrity protein fraC [Cyanobacteria bacterium UBA8543]